eukprot:6460961-Amphidinium_carterae.1
MGLVDRDAVLGTDRRGSQVRTSEYQYFHFAGALPRVWDPVFLARLAWEGFFTITSELDGRGREPLPELQPFYGVIDWKDLNLSKNNRKVLRKLKQSSSG